MAASFAILASMALRPIVETLMRSCFDAGAGMGRDWTEREALGEGRTAARFMMGTKSSGRKRQILGYRP